MADAIETELTPPISPPPAPAIASPFVPSPFSFLFTDDDALLLTSWSDDSTARLGLSGRRMDPSGDVRPFRFDHTPNSDRSARQEVFRPGPGYLLNLTVFATDGAFYYGQAYARVEVVRGSGASRAVLGTLIGGTIGRNDPQAWPGSEIRASLDSPGYTSFIAISGPGAGLEIARTVPDGAVWEILAVNLQFVTDATVANRRVGLLQRIGAVQFARVFADVDQPASQSLQYAFAAGGPTTPGSAVASRGLSYPIGQRLPEAFELTTSTQNLQAGDAYAAMVLFVRAWLATSSGP